MIAHGFPTDEPEKIKHRCLVASGFSSSILQAGKAATFCGAFFHALNSIDWVDMVCRFWSASSRYQGLMSSRVNTAKMPLHLQRRHGNYWELSQCRHWLLHVPQMFSFLSGFVKTWGRLGLVPVTCWCLGVWAIYFRSLMHPVSRSGFGDIRFS